MKALVYTTVSARPELQRRSGARLKVYGRLDALDPDRSPPTAAISDVREVATDLKLTDHAWLQVREKDWPKWEDLRTGDTISCLGTIERYGKPGRPDHGFTDVVLIEMATAYTEGKKEPTVVASRSPSTEAKVVALNINDLIEGLKNLNLQNLDLLEFKLKEQRARQKERAIEVLRAEMKERATKVGLSLPEIIEALMPAPEAEVRKVSKARLPPKFANPDDPSETWTGRGHRPGWLKEKMEAGHRLEEFRIKETTNGAGAAS